MVRIKVLLNLNYNKYSEGYGMDNTSIEKMILSKLEEMLKDNKVNCFTIMQPRIIKYVEGSSLQIGFPVLKEYLNPAKGMQGGFITAAFDNTFGTLFVCANEEAIGTTIDIATSYQRPIFCGDELQVTVYLKHMGKTIVHMTGEAFNREGKLIATANTNIMILKK